MCRAEPWLKSLHVEFTTGKWVRGGFRVSALGTAFQSPEVHLSLNPQAAVPPAASDRAPPLLSHTLPH